MSNIVVQRMFIRIHFIVLARNIVVPFCDPVLNGETQECLLEGSRYALCEFIRNYVSSSCKCNTESFVDGDTSHSEYVGRPLWTRSQQHCFWLDHGIFLIQTVTNSEITQHNDVAVQAIVRCPIRYLIHAFEVPTTKCIMAQGTT